MTSVPIDSYSLKPREVEYFHRKNWLIPHFDVEGDLVPASNGEVVHFFRRSQHNIRVRVVLLRGSTDDERLESQRNMFYKAEWWKGHRHDNLVNIQGFYPTLGEPPILRLISEGPKCTIVDYLEQNPAHDRHKSCVDIAAGVDFLHRHSIVHGAIRGSNVLVKDDGTCCLAEFSPEHIPCEHTLILYANWIAPELVESKSFGKLEIDHYRSNEYRGEYKEPSDIFALGCTSIEIFTGAPPAVIRIPYDKITGHKELAQFPLRQPSDIERKEIPERILSAISDMLDYIPNRRPNSGNASTWLAKPNVKRFKSVSPVNAKGLLWRASREKDI